MNTYLINLIPIYCTRPRLTLINNNYFTMYSLVTAHMSRNSLHMEMKATILFAVVLLRSAGVNAVAPGDQQSSCFSTELPTSPGHGLINAYTSTQRPLMDSYWYDRVVGTTGVWDFIEGNVDDNGVSMILQ